MYDTLIRYFGSWPNVLYCNKRLAYRGFVLRTVSKAKVPVVLKQISSEELMRTYRQMIMSCPKCSFAEWKPALCVKWCPYPSLPFVHWVLHQKVEFITVYPAKTQTLFYLLYFFIFLGPVARRLNSAIHWIASSSTFENGQKALNLRVSTP